MNSMTSPSEPAAAAAADECDQIRPPGQTLLEERVCKCGCQGKFRCFPSSAQVFASQACVLLGPPPEEDRNPYAKLTGIRRGRPKRLGI